jgi:CRP-like cAMP-binding protein
MPDDPPNIAMLRIDLAKVELADFVQKDELLWRAPLLNCFGEVDRLELLRQSSVCSAEGGQTLIEEDTTPAGLHLVLDGSLVLATNAGSIDLATLGKGDFFGLGALFPEAVRPAAIAASEGVRTALMPPAFFIQRVRSVAALGKLLAKVAKERLERSRECSEFLDMW